LLCAVGKLAFGDGGYTMAAREMKQRRAARAAGAAA
jgi:hypothetical protein